jgi:hypothetical protein
VKFQKPDPSALVMHLHSSRDYAFPEELGNLVLCFDAVAGYSVLTLDNKIPTKAIVPLK